MKNKGVVAGILAAVSTLVGIAMIRYAAIDLSGLELTILRMWVSVVVLVLLFGRKVNFGKYRKLSVKDKILLTVVGIFLWSGGILFYNMATLYTSLLNVSLVASFQPLLVYLIAVGFLHNRFNWKLVTYLGISVYGVLVVGSRSFLPSALAFGKGEMLALGSMALLSMSFVVRKYLSKHLNPEEISFPTVLLAAISLTIYGFAWSALPSVSELSGQAIIAILIGGAASAMIGYFNNVALAALSPAFVSQMSRLVTVGVLIMGIVLFDEVPGIIEIFGGLLIVGSVYASKNIELSAR